MENKPKWKYRPYTPEEVHAALNQPYEPMSDEEYLAGCRDNVASQKAMHFYHEMGRRTNLTSDRCEKSQNSDVNSAETVRLPVFNSVRDQLNSAVSVRSPVLNFDDADFNFSISDESPLIDMRFGRLYVLAYKRGTGYLCKCTICGKNELVTAHGNQSYAARIKYLGKRLCQEQPRKALPARVPDQEAEHLGKMFGRLLVTGYTRGTGYQCVCLTCGETETVKPAAGRSYLMLLGKAGSRACGSK